jgi:hypothetical protein
MAVAEKASPEAREAPLIKTAALRWNSENFCWREAMVRLPAGMLLTDLLDTPAVWKPLQSVKQTQLARGDRVTCVSADESWCVKDILVVSADNTKVILALKASDRISLPAKLPGEIARDD